VIAQAGSSAIGRRFYETGPGKGEKVLTAYLRRAMARGQLRPTDAEIAARHLMALLKAGLEMPLLYGVRSRVTKAQIDDAVDRAVDVFLAAYGA
jgi:AcrR family transcriptional regulator